MKLCKPKMAFVEESVRQYYEGRRDRVRGIGSRVVLATLMVFVFTFLCAIGVALYSSHLEWGFLELPTGLFVGAFLLAVFVFLVVSFRRRCARERAWNLTDEEIEGQVEQCMSEIKALDATLLDVEEFMDFMRDFRCSSDTVEYKARVVCASPGLMSLTFIQDVWEEYRFPERRDAVSGHA